MRRGEAERRSVVGVRRPRIDSEPKVRGATRYAADLPEPGLLHARLVLSQHAHAFLERIDSVAALAAPGVVAVLTARDLPIVGDAAGRAAEPLAREEIVFAGQPVAIVIADSEAAAEDAAGLIAVDCRPLDAVLDLEAAMRPGARPARIRKTAGEASELGGAHTAVAGSAEDEDAAELSENVVSRRRLAEGDAADALAASDAVVSGRFRTGWLYQAYLEPQTATAWVEPDGELVVRTSTQAAFHTRAQLATLFGLPLPKVRVVPTPLGGAFGGKLMVTEPLVAGAALALGRPVRLAMTRSEDFLASNPSPGGLIELRVGGNRSGELTALEARIAFERGAFHEWGIESVSAVLVGGPYRWQAFDVRAYGVETNRVGFGAYRAPGAPPAAFALESLLDELAGTLDLDPVELRIANAASEDDARFDGKPWPRHGMVGCLERLREHELWRGRERLPPGEGVGLAVGYWPGASNPAAAGCRFDDDGGITIATGSVDMSGTASGFAVIAAEAFGVPVEQVRVVAGDTAASPKAPISGGSQVTYAVGRAVEQAARAAREQLLTIAAAELEADPADLEVVDGTVRPRGAPGQAVSLAELAKRISSKYEPVDARGGAAPTTLAPAVAAHLAHVRVDPDTGRVTVLGWAVAQDVGRALNPALVEGQMRGAVAQAIGWSLLEELVVDPGGQVLTGSFMEYAVPGSTDVPEIDTLVVEVPAPNGPLGAKGVGEAPVAGGPAAVANAIAAAAGVRLRELPMTPPRVWAALHDS